MDFLLWISLAFFLFLSPFPRSLFMDLFHSLQLSSRTQDFSLLSSFAYSQLFSSTSCVGWFFPLITLTQLLALWQDPHLGLLYPSPGSWYRARPAVSKAAELADRLVSSWVTEGRGCGFCHCLPCSSFFCPHTYMINKGIVLQDSGFLSVCIFIL